MIQKNAKEFTHSFLSVPFKEALENKDYRTSLYCSAVILFLILPYLIWKNITERNNSYFLIFEIIPIIIIFLLIGIHNYKIILNARIKRIADSTNIDVGLPSNNSILIAMQKWFCKKYQCAPSELIKKSKEQAELWEFWRSISSEIDIDSKYNKVVKDFIFKLPDPSRFATIITAFLAIIITLFLASESSKDSFFIILDKHKELTIKTIGYSVIITEIVFLFSMFSPPIIVLCRKIKSTLSPKKLMESEFKAYLNEMILAAGVQEVPPRKTGKTLQSIEKIASILFMSPHRSITTFFEIVVSLNFAWILIIGETIFIATQLA